MSWRTVLDCVKKQSKLSIPPCYVMKSRNENGVLYVGTRFSLQQPGGYPWDRKTSWRAKLPHLSRETILGCKMSSSRCVHVGQSDLDLSRDFFVQLWRADQKKSKSYRNQRHNFFKSSSSGKEFVDGRTLTGALERYRSLASDLEKSFNRKSALRQPPTSQSITGTLKPMSVEETKVAPLLARSNLLITRDIEWANLALGFEQENRYAIVDVCYPQTPVGFIREQSNVIARQLLRLRRPFIAYITDGLGNELFRVRRPFWWITSSIYAEINGTEIGVVHRRWHLWRRIYDLYLGSLQLLRTLASGTGLSL